MPDKYRWHRRLRGSTVVSAMLLVILLLGCAKPTAGTLTRSYRMGFSHFAPRLELSLILQTIDLWSSRGDAAIIALTPPWKSMLADTSPAFLVRRDNFDLVQLYRARGKQVVVMMDATDGLAREKEAPELVALGRSISEPAVRALYRELAVAVDSILHPDYLGLSMETNLIRAIAPVNVYEGVRLMANETATALRLRNTTAKLFSSVQVETAWGKLPATGKFEGIAKDLEDFAFGDVLGLSSYPYFAGFGDPENIPSEYYQRLKSAASLPVMIVEGGWTSASIGNIISSPALQARYIKRQMQLADRAQAVGIFQLTFTDLDVNAYGPAGGQLGPFAWLGLVVTNLAAKPALAEWDRAFARPLRQ